MSAWKTIFEFRAQWIMTCCMHSNTSSLFQSYLYRWNHTKNSKLNWINAWTGLVSSKPPYFSLWLCISSSKRSNTRNGSNIRKWRISITVTEPRREPDIIPEAELKQLLQLLLLFLRWALPRPWMHEAAEKATGSWTTWEEGCRAGRWMFCQLHDPSSDLTFKSFPACF